MEVIFPCAGLSTRFPNLRPKYLLTDYKGKLMIEDAVNNLCDDHRVTIAILKDHDVRFNARNKLIEAFGFKVNIITLDTPTRGPADTVYQTIIKGNVPSSAQLLIKDCDSFYDTNYTEGNAVYVSKLSKNPNVRNAAAKSYTITNDQNIITSIIEKQIVSDSFSVGGYQFASVIDFVKAYESLQNQTTEIFVSNIVDYLISNGSVFVENEVQNYVDVGTSDDWFEFNNKPTYFCDIDGTIITTKDYHDECEPLYDNISFLKKEKERGCMLIFCTARPIKYEQLTKKMLNELGFGDCQLIMGVHHSKRVLINDYAPSNPYPSAVAVNLKRDQDTLSEMLN